MVAAARITVEEAYDKVKAGQALLVCSYDSEEKFNRNHLEGAISLREFASRLTAVAKTEELIFYCA